MEESNPTGAIVLLDDTPPRRRLHDSSVAPGITPDPLPESLARYLDGASDPPEADLAAGRALGMPRLHALLLRARAGHLLARPAGSPNVMVDDVRIPDVPEGVWSPAELRDRPSPFLLRAIVRPCEVGPVSMVVSGRYQMVEETICRAIWFTRTVLLLPGMVARIDPANALLFGTDLSPRETVAIMGLSSGELAGPRLLYDRDDAAQYALAKARAKASGH